jgi:hypothetical protein
MLSPELEERFRRVYAAVGEAYSREPDQYVRVGEIPAARGFQIARIRFDGGRSRAQLKNDAIHAVAAVANLRDHLRRFARERGRDPDEVDATIKASPDLAVLMDLYDFEKHGEEKRGPRRWSGLLPRLGDVTKALRFMGGGAPPSFSITMIPGQRIYSNPQVQGDAASVISADVVDEKGKKIGGGDLVSMVESGLGAYEQMLTTWGVSLPPRT